MSRRILYGQWLVAFELADGIWRVSDRGQDNMYVVVGSEKAMVIDTGFGIENLADFVKSITPLPTVTVITHVHLDHAFGNDAFDEVWAGQADINELSDADPEPVREFFRSSGLMTDMTAMPAIEGDGTHAKKSDRTITEGIAFDLGGRTVTAHYTPGHTAGSVCFLDEKSRTLFVGDAFVPGDTWGQAWYHIGGAPLKVFHESMSKLVSAGGFDWVCSGHGESDLIPARSLQLFLDGIQAIIDGKAVGKPTHTFAGDGLLCEFEGSSIVYSKENII